MESYYYATFKKNLFGGNFSGQAKFYLQGARHVRMGQYSTTRTAVRESAAVRTRESRFVNSEVASWGSERADERIFSASSQS